MSLLIHRHFIGEEVITKLADVSDNATKEVPKQNVDAGEVAKSEPPADIKQEINRSDIMAMKVADLKTFAEKNDIEVEDGISGVMLKKVIIDKLGL